MGDQHVPEKHTESKAGTAARSAQRGDLNLLDLSAGRAARLEAASDRQELQSEIEILQREVDRNPDLRQMYKSIAAIPAALRTEGGGAAGQALIDARQQEALDARVNHFKTLSFDEQLAEVVRVANHMQALGQLIELHLKQQG